MLSPRDLGPDANAAHQARMHRAEAPKIHGRGQAKLLNRGLEMPTPEESSGAVEAEGKAVGVCTCARISEVIRRGVP